MPRYIVRRLGFTLLTMVLVSLAIFGIAEVVPGDVARHVLGQFATPAGCTLRDQMGLNQPLVQRYVDWLIGTTARLRRWSANRLGWSPSRRARDPSWWAVGKDGALLQWRMKDGELVETRLGADGTKRRVRSTVGRPTPMGRRFFMAWTTPIMLCFGGRAGRHPRRSAAAGRTLSEAAGEVLADPRASCAGIRVFGEDESPVWPTLTRRIGNSLVLAGSRSRSSCPSRSFLASSPGSEKGSCSTGRSPSLAW